MTMAGSEMVYFLYVELVFLSIKREPTTFLFNKMWQFSAGQKKKIALFVVMFLCSNLISLLGPYIFSRIVNEIQKNGITSLNISHLLFLISTIIISTIVFWFFHGIGRVLERKVAFFVKVAYREYLLNGVISMGLSWHSSRDSGDTIDKINKAVDGLHRFCCHTFSIRQAASPAVS